jgi:aminoglycoside phosphotransferase (APT) family kinase protein
LLQTAPDLAGFCRDTIGRDPVDVVPIGRGANSRVFRVAFDGAHAPAVVKFYRRDPGDARDRLATEFGALQFFAAHGLHNVPRAIARDGERYCAMYEWLSGEVPDCAAAAAGEIDAMARFLGQLRRISAVSDAPSAAASEACFSLAAITASVRGRIAALQAGAAHPDRRLMSQWLDDRARPLLEEVVQWVRRSAGASGISYDEELGPQARALSPSDFGLHNAIRRPDGSLAFVDFEYFGWDDPSKTIADFLLHPGMSLPAAHKTRFARQTLEIFADVPRLAERARLVYPLFALKWCTILLNAFLPDRAATSVDGASYRQAQLEKAQRLVDRVAREYRANPYLS